MMARPVGAGQAVALLLAVLSDPASEPDDQKHGSGDEQNPQERFHGRQDNW